MVYAMKEKAFKVQCQKMVDLQVRIFTVTKRYSFENKDLCYLFETCLIMHSTFSPRNASYNTFQVLASIKKGIFLENRNAGNFFIC